MAASASIAGRVVRRLGLGCEGGELVAHPGEDAWPARRRRAAGRTSGTGRCGRGRRRRGSAAGWRATSRSRTSRARLSSGGSGQGSASQRWSSDVASWTSGAERCWARKTRKTASSSSGVRSKLGDAVVRAAPWRACRGSSREGPRARRRGSAGRCGSARGGCARGARCGAPRRPGGCGSARRSRRRPRGLHLVGERRAAPLRRARRAPRGSSAASVPRRAGRCRSRAPWRRGPPGRGPHALQPWSRPVRVRRAGRGRRSRQAPPRPPRRRRRRARAARSGAPVSTWLPAETSSSLTRAAKGAGSTVSIFIDSSTSTGAPAATSSPTATGVATTRAGAGERSTPPSSRLTRWVTPSTSTRWTGPWVAVMRRCDAAGDREAAGVLVDAVEVGVDDVLVAVGGDGHAEAVRPRSRRP